MILSADGIVLLGTANSFQSEYCKMEILYADSQNIPVYPILVDSADGVESPNWFTGRSILGHGEKVYANHFSSKEWSIDAIIRSIRRGRGADLRCIALITFLFLVLSPLPIVYFFSTMVGHAGEAIKAQQERIERINAAVESRDPSSSGIYSRRTGENRRDWLDVQSGVLIAWDEIDETIVRRRHFLDSEGEIALDTIELVRAPDSTISLRKIRKIWPRQMYETIIEEEFDGSGALISKRVRLGQDSKWYDYRDVAHSIYPSIVPVFRTFTYR